MAGRSSCAIGRDSDVRQVLRQLSKLGLELVVDNKDGEFCALRISLSFRQSKEFFFNVLLQLGYGVLQRLS